MPTIPIPRFNDFTPEDVGSEEFIDRLTKLSRSLEYIMNHMDHDNVRRLHTEECTIQSQYGETYINGPQLKMYGIKSAVVGSTSTGVLRLQMGYDSGTSDFIFKMWNATGSTMIELDSSGSVVFMGTLRSGSTAGERIEISGNSLRTYNSSNHLTGPAWGSTATLGGQWGDLSLYHDGTKTALLYDDITGYTFKPASTAHFVQLGSADSAGFNTYIGGNVKHLGPKLGFYNKAPIAQLSIVQTASTVADIIRDKLNELIDDLHKYGLFSS